MIIAKFDYKEKKTVPAILREVKRILSDRQNFCQGETRQATQATHTAEGIVIGRVCTLGAIALVAADQRGRKRAQAALRTVLEQKFGAGGIAMVNDGHVGIEGGLGQKERARLAIIESIDEALA